MQFLIKHHIEIIICLNKEKNNLRLIKIFQLLLLQAQCNFDTNSYYYYYYYRKYESCFNYNPKIDGRFINEN